MRLRLSRVTALLFLLAILVVADPSQPSGLRWIIFNTILDAAALRYPIVALALAQFIHELTTPS